MSGQKYPNDEDHLVDRLGHNEVIRHLADVVLTCDAPYSISINGPWGSGKTSFLKKMWAFLGGEFEIPDGGSNGPIKQLRWCEDQFGAEYRNAYKDLWGSPKKTFGFDRIKTVWFNPCRHQFEENPLVALVHEMRTQLSLSEKTLNATKKMANITANTLLDSVGDMAKLLPGASFLQGLTAKEIRAKGEAYEAAKFQSSLSSERFRAVFEQTVNALTTGLNGKKPGRLVIFIDDLDRCEGAAAYQVLETLKLYLNVPNCVFVLGINPTHLEESIGRVLSVDRKEYDDEPEQSARARERYLAREYIGKMLQHQFPLPRPQSVQKLLDSLIGEPFLKLMQEKFTPLGEVLNKASLIGILSESLPHNPRKIKQFVAAWRLYSEILAEQLEANREQGDWKMAAIVCYLSQFEEALFRKIEENPSGISPLLIAFVKTPDMDFDSRNGLIPGLVLPPNSTTIEQEGGYYHMENRHFNGRVFWIANLVSQVFGNDWLLSDRDTGLHFITRHLIKPRGAKPSALSGVEGT